MAQTYPSKEDVVSIFENVKTGNFPEFMKSVYPEIFKRVTCSTSELATKFLTKNQENYTSISQQQLNNKF